METIERAINTVASGGTLSRDEASEVMHLLAAGHVTGAQFGALAMGLRVRGEHVEEIAGFAHAMRELALDIDAGPGLVDTCGTGGDHSNSFNISTTAAFVVAGAGGKVAKHGNRSVSSSCGSADVLEALGARIELAPDLAIDVLDSCGFCFLFAPTYHPAMASVAAHRRELKLRTVFNLLGPLTNPARVEGQVLGVADGSKQRIMAEVLRELGVQRALVVHGAEGLDELSLAGPSRVVELRDGSLTEYEVEPEDVGLERAPLEALVGGDADLNAEILRAVLRGEAGARRDAVVINAAAALVAANIAADLSDGVAIARRAIDDGSAIAALDGFVAHSTNAEVAA
jgi:anthranilate phosphoribosyltransferase